MHIDIATVLDRRYHGKLWVLEGDCYDGLTWNDNSPKPSLDDLESAWPDVRDEIAFESMRRERDTRLAASDWTQVTDAPVDMKAWAKYRQALRDLPANTDDPSAPKWPVPPA